MYKMHLNLEYVQFVANHYLVSIQYHIHNLLFEEYQKVEIILILIVILIKNEILLTKKKNLKKKKKKM